MLHCSNNYITSININNNKNIIPINNKNLLIRKVSNSVFQISSLLLLNKNFIKNSYGYSKEECLKCSDNGDQLCAKCLIIENNNSLLKESKYFYNPINSRIYDTTKKSFLPGSSSDTICNELKNRRVVVIGENHYHPCHHKIEFDILKAISTKYGYKNVAVGLECFYRQHQNALDRFIYIHKNLAKLKEECKWNENWGYDLNYYAKIFQYCAIHNIRIIGLNLPYPVAQLTAKVGLKNLPQELSQLLPEVDLTNKKHRDQFYKAMVNTKHSISNDETIENMYETQTLWDEYMSDSASHYLLSNPSNLLLCIAGIGHVLGRVGIPDRIKRRTNLDSFVIVPTEVEWTDEGLPVNLDRPGTIEDFDWNFYTEINKNLS